MEILPFHVWKDSQVKKDSLIHGCLYLRERDWYWSEYGRYCLKQRK